MQEAMIMVDHKIDVLQSRFTRSSHAVPQSGVQRAAKVACRKLQTSEFTIDDSDSGGDPYNCTGRFSVLKDPR